MNKEEKKSTMICYLGTFNWNIAKLKTKTYEEIEEIGKKGGESKWEKKEN